MDATEITAADNDTDLWSEFVSLSHDDAAGEWVAASSSGAELARSASLESMLSRLASAGGGELTG
jgi:hypothetical protein